MAGFPSAWLVRYKIVRLLHGGPPPPSHKDSTMTTRARLFVVACVVSLAGLAASPAATAALLGPSPYSSTANSPFSPFAGFAYFHLDNFDDHALNPPGVSVTAGTNAAALMAFPAPSSTRSGSPAVAPRVESPSRATPGSATVLPA
jgi:hypothetical protein